MSFDGPRHDEIDQAFWLAHMRVGFGVLVGESLAILAYLLA